MFAKPIVFLLLSSITSVAATNADAYSVKATYHFPGTSPWDYVTVDSETRRVYVAHDTKVDVLNADDGALIGQVLKTPGVHGVAISNELGRGFTSNGGDDSVTIFDLRTLATIGKVKVGSRPDRIYYDARSQRVFTCNHGSGNITALDGKTGKTTGLININGGGEQLVPQPDGLIFVANADTSEVISFDPKTLQIRAYFPLGPGKEPHGLAFDPVNNRLFAACRNKVMIVIDSRDGRHVATLPIGETVDMAAFDPKKRTVFCSNGDGSLSVFRQLSADHYEDAGSVKTGPNAKQMDFDAKTGKIFLPSGVITDAPAEKGNKPIHTVRAGTFAILVVGR